MALAVGVLIEAFVVRMTLVPAAVTLLGDRAWSLPGWLDRLLPNLDIEGESLGEQRAPEAAQQQPKPGKVDVDTTT
jgi:putative drug exporter of the RND superfamily